MSAPPGEGHLRASPGPRPARLRVASGAALAGATCVTVSSFLPWMRSGTAERTSYQLVVAAERLEVLGPGQQRVAMAWYLVMAVVGAAWIAAAVHRHVVVASLCGAVGALALALSVAVFLSPMPALIGAQIAAVTSAVALISSIAVAGISLRSGARRAEERA